MQSLSPSQERVLAALRTEPLRAQAIGDELGVDASAVRRHLDHLEAMGLVETYDVVDGPGRPKRFFRLTPAGRETGPRNYALLLASLMRKVADGGGRKLLFRHLEAIAADLAGSPDRSRDAKVRLDLLLAKYNALGFQAEIVQEGKNAVLIQRNCPFLAAATADPEALCQHLDESIVRAALPGVEVELDQAMAKGDTFCRHILSGVAAPKKVQRPPPASDTP